jgi:hypothetical protein
MGASVSEAANPAVPISPLQFAPRKKKAERGFWRSAFFCLTAKGRPDYRIESVVVSVVVVAQ